MVSPAVIVEGWEVGKLAGEQFPTDLSAGAFTMKANHKGTLESRAPRMRAHPYDSWYLGLS